MNDLIRRQAAIEALEEPLKVSDTWTDEYAVGERMQWEKDVKALNSLPPAQQWTPVVEDLPKEYGDYIVSDGESAWVCEFIACAQMWHSYPRDTDIIAWMPLPEPYKEGG